MNIVLTTKDADAIIGYLREELAAITEFQTERAKEFKKLTEDFKEDPSIHNNEHCIATYNEAAEFYNERMTELNKESNEILHYIELLTCGSEVTE
jgi:prefoldin subunit 5